MFSWLSDSAEKIIKGEGLDKVIEVYQRDISEFANQISESAKPLASLLPQLPILEEDEIVKEEESSAQQRSKETPEQRLVRLQSSVSTFATPVTAEEDQLSRQLGSVSFEEYWNMDMNSEQDDGSGDADSGKTSGRKLLEEKTEEITRHLETHEPLNDMFANLVPTEVSYEDFWKRYLFRYELYLLDEKRRETVERLTSELNEDHFDSWDDDEEEEEDKGHTMANGDELAKMCTWYEHFKNIQLDNVNLDGSTKQRILDEVVEFYEQKLRNKDALIEQLKKEIADLKQKNSSDGADLEQEQAVKKTAAERDAADSGLGSSRANSAEWEVVDRPQEGEQEGESASTKTDETEDDDYDDWD